MKKTPAIIIILILVASTNWGNYMLNKNLFTKTIVIEKEADYCINTAETYDTLWEESEKLIEKTTTQEIIPDIAVQKLNNCQWENSQLKLICNERVKTETGKLQKTINDLNNLISENDKAINICMTSKN